MGKNLSPGSKNMISVYSHSNCAVYSTHFPNFSFHTLVLITCSSHEHTPSSRCLDSLMKKRNRTPGRECALPSAFIVFQKQNLQSWSQYLLAGSSFKRYFSKHCALRKAKCQVAVTCHPLCLRPLIYIFSTKTVPTKKPAPQ